MAKDKYIPPYSDHSAGAAIAHAARLMSQTLAEAQQDLNIAPAQYRILTELWKYGGLTQRDLVARLDIEQSTIGNTLSRMERDGLIQRKPHPTDGRAQIIGLTARARKLKEPAMAIGAKINNVALSGFSAAEKAQFREFMNRIISALKEGVD